MANRYEPPNYKKNKVVFIQLGRQCGKTELLNKALKQMVEVGISFSEACKNLTIASKRFNMELSKVQNSTNFIKD